MSEIARVACSTGLPSLTVQPLVFQAYVDRLGDHSTAASGQIQRKKSSTTRNSPIRPECLYYAYILRSTKEQLPEHYVHRRVLPNPLGRYLTNKESKLQYVPDGSLTLYFADSKPKDAPDGNWLPTPKGKATA